MVRIAFGDKVKFVHPPHFNKIPGETKFPALAGITTKANHPLDKTSGMSDVDARYEAGTLRCSDSQACYCILRPDGFFAILYEKHLVGNVNVAFFIDIKTGEKFAAEAALYFSFPWSQVRGFRQTESAGDVRIAIELNHFHVTLEAITTINFPRAEDNQQFAWTCEEYYSRMGLKAEKAILFKTYQRPLADYLEKIFIKRVNNGLIKRAAPFRYPVCDEHRVTAIYSGQVNKYLCPKCNKDLTDKLPAEI
ncbi:MAG: hypothetical protein HZB92_08475 [Euryarchaeota archaeon]|nr:hypothetical protein [Euryarchaeota archaeon]